MFFGKRKVITYVAVAVFKDRAIDRLVAYHQGNIDQMGGNSRLLQDVNLKAPCAWVDSVSVFQLTHQVALHSKNTTHIPSGKDSEYGRKRLVLSIALRQPWLRFVHYIFFTKNNIVSRVKIGFETALPPFNRSIALIENAKVGNFSSQ
jgi:hypothetical protein